MCIRDRVITWGRDRKEALSRMVRALEEYRIKGIKTTIPFHKRILNYPPFIEGNYHTQTITEVEPSMENHHIEIGAVAATIVAMAETRISIQKARPGINPWKLSGRVNGLRGSGW